MENELIKSLLGMAEIMESLGDLPKAKTIRSAADTLEKQAAEIQRLNSCVKSEDEVREIMKASMGPMVKEMTAELFDEAEKKWMAEIERVISQRNATASDLLIAIKLAKADTTFDECFFCHHNSQRDGHSCKHQKQGFIGDICGGLVFRGIATETKEAHNG